MKHKFLLCLACMFICLSAQAQNYWDNTPRVGTNGLMEIGKFVDFHESANDGVDFSIRLTSLNGILHTSGGVQVSGHIGLTGHLTGKSMLLSAPNNIGDWNTIWQSGFFDGYNASNAPENGWFWGANFNHRSNNSSYRYNGQIAIKNSNKAPTMYFRSTDVNGVGVWAKVLHNQGNQEIQGTLGIGTTTLGSHKLAVEGSIGARSIKVQATGWSDFVFESKYYLPTLQEVETHIKEKGHLKDIPSAQEVTENGIDLGEMDAKLLQKIEELTLYTIQQEKQIERLKLKDQEVEELKAEMKALKELFTNLANEN